MKITEHIERSQKTLFSFEILPPLKGESIHNLFAQIDKLIEFSPPFIDVTYHREEYILKKNKNGIFEQKSISKRPGTVGICAAINNKYQIDAVPHIICGGFTKEETENALIDLNFLGIDNLLVLQGDVIKSEERFIPKQGGNKYAIELLEQVKNMNRGIYLDEKLEKASVSDFCVGVAAYPEKHYASPDFSTDMKWLKEKVDKGADYIVTQMFFDNNKFFEFVNKCKELGINIPIIPGIKPITVKKQIEILPSIFHTQIPDDLISEIKKCKDNLHVKEVGIEWAVNQSKELMNFGVPVLHYYSMSRADVIYDIAKQLF